MRGILADVSERADVVISGLPLQEVRYLMRDFPVSHF
jgi:hypothetical protein